MQQHASTYSVLTHTLDFWGGVKRSKHFFFTESSHVAYQIKGNGTQSTMQAHICASTPLTSGVGSKGQNICFTESSHVA